MGDGEIETVVPPCPLFLRSHRFSTLPESLHNRRGDRSDQDCFTKSAAAFTTQVVACWRGSAGKAQRPHRRIEHTLGY